MAMNEQLRDIAERACARARKAGASEAGAGVRQRRVTKVAVQDGKYEEIKASESRSLSLRVFVNGRYGSHQTSDLSPAGMDRFIDDAVEMTKVLMPDTFRALPEPSLYKGRSTADLGIYDPAQAALTTAQRKARAMALHDKARADTGDKVISVGTGFSDNLNEWVRVHTNGFADGDRSTTFAQWASVSAKDPSGRRPSDWAEGMARKLADLARPEVTGAEAASRTLAQIGSKTLPSVELPIIVEARAVHRVLGGLLAPMNGQSLDQKRSCMEGKLGQKIASPLLTITDDPLLPGGWASQRFDGEGLTTRRRPIIEAGVLKGLYIDTYYGKKLKQAPTGGGQGNLIFAQGKRDLDALCAAADKAVLITRFIGGNSNGTTGDFSHGIFGFLIEKGKRTTPLASMNIAGNHLAFWKGLTELGNDPYPHSPSLTPSLRFKSMMIAGK